MNYYTAEFHTVGGGYSPLTWVAPPPLYISGQIYFNMQQHFSYKPSGAPKATRSNLREPKFIKFPGGTHPNPYKSSVLHVIDSFPCLTQNPI